MHNICLKQHRNWIPSSIALSFFAVCVLPLCGLRILMFPFNIANEKTSIFNGSTFKSILYWTYISNDMHAIAPEGSTQHTRINRNFGWFSIELSWFQTGFNQIDLFDRFADFIDSIWWYSCSWWAFKFASIAHISNWHRESFRVFLLNRIHSFRLICALPFNL